MINILSKNKFRFARGYSYISMFGIPLLIVDMLERRIPGLPFIPVFVIAMAGVWTIGYVDDKFGFLDAEQSYGVSKNKLLMEGLYKWDLRLNEGVQNEFERSKRFNETF